jgi:hypothetical protein
LQDVQEEPGKLDRHELHVEAYQNAAVNMLFYTI